MKPTDDRPRRRRAVALRYDGEGAPKVTAKGEGRVAERIIELAREHNIPYSENAELAGLLGTIELGDEIPEELYVAVAHVLAFAYALDPSKVPPEMR